MKSINLWQSKYLLLCIALFLTSNISAQQKFDQTAHLLFAPEEVTCGANNQRGKVPMKRDTICALNVTEAKKKYEDKVKDEAEMRFTCVEPLNCTGSVCELYLLQIPDNAPIVDGDKYIFRKRTLIVKLECICGEAAELDSIPSPTDSLICGDDDKVIRFDMGKQFLPTNNFQEAKNNYELRVIRQAKNLIRCKDPDNCGQDPCELKIKETSYFGNPVSYFGNHMSPKKRVKVLAECPCGDAYIPDPQEESENRLANDPEQWMQQPFPNPAKQNIFVPLYLNETPQALSIVLHNINGQQVVVQEFKDLGPGAHQLQLQTTDLPNGLYYTTLYLNHQRIESYPIFIQH